MATVNRQKSLFASVLENAPSLVFLMLLQWSGDLRLAGWAGAVSSAIVCAAYLVRKLRPHPILLGINMYMLLISPVIEGLVLLGMDALADMFIGNALSFVLVAIFLTGSALTAVAKGGFLGAPGKHRRRVVQYSIVLLIVSILCMAWAFSVEA